MRGFPLKELLHQSFSRSRLSKFRRRESFSLGKKDNYGVPWSVKLGQSANLTSGEVARALRNYDKEAVISVTAEKREGVV